MKYRWSCLIGLFLICCTANYSQCLSGDCLDGSGEYLYDNGARFTGHFKDGQATGAGSMIFPNGDVYEGQWKNGLREGEGTLSSPGNFVYTGDFLEDKFHGKGRMDFDNEDSYVGDFDNGTFHGKGIFTSSGGFAISGLWEEGSPVGQVSRPAPIEDQTDEPESQPASSNISLIPQVDYPKDCNIKWCHLERGEYRYRDGTIYKGMFVQGAPEGRGEVNYPGGEVYVGNWKDHAPHGEGLVTYPNGLAYGAIWNNGEPIQVLHPRQEIEVESVDVDYSDAEKIRAVIIGVSRYDHMTHLDYTDDDAFYLYSYLKSHEGGALADDQIELLIDDGADRKSIIKALQKTFYRADDNDVILLYFSGHGLNGRLLASDYDGYNNSIQYEEIKNIFNRSRAKSKIILTDACYSGSMMESGLAIPPTQSGLISTHPGLVRHTDDIILISSSREEEASMESSGLRQGIFSHFLIRGLRGEADSDLDGALSIQELFNYTSFEVRQHTNGEQNPIIRGNYDPGLHLRFYREGVKRRLGDADDF